MKKTINFLITIFTVGCFSAQIPTGYYDAAAGLTGYTLKTKLSQIISTGVIDNGYSALMDAYKVGDLDKYYENDNTILDVYSEKPLATDSYTYVPGVKECGSYSGEGSCYNREHVFPQSFFNEASPMKNDYHHILPTDGYVNGRRSNYPYGTVGTATWTSTNGSKVGSCNFSGYSGTVFEPIDEFKGDIARILLYFVTRYESKLTSFDYSDTNNPQDGSTNRSFDQWYINLLLKWHHDDPVSQKEIDRNNYAYTYQKNRNPYVDHPEYVDLIWTSTLATDENTFADTAIKLSQNPVKNGVLNLSGKNISKIAKAEIYNATGQLLQVINDPFKNSNTTIVLKQNKKGFYVLKVDNQSIKFVVE